MAHSVSARKRVRQNENARSYNRWRTRTLKDSLKEFEEKMMHGSYEEATKAFRDACQVLDRTAQNGVIHKNTAGRKKSRLNARLKAKKTSK